MATFRGDPQPPDKGESVSKNMAADAWRPGKDGLPDSVDGEHLLQLVGEAERISREYHTETLERPIQLAYRAWRNEHNQGSKYLSGAYRGRSRLFVPKTRTAIRKNMAAAAAALFSTNEAVDLKASFEDDDQQRATAATLKALMDLRLGRSSERSGIPWFLICMGGHLDGQLTGVTISKQSWEFEEQPTGNSQPELVEIEDEATGELYEDVEDVEEMRVVSDRPMIDLIPIENSGIDPAAPWYDPIQQGAWFHARYPLRLDQIRTMMANQDHDWLQDVPDDLLLKGRIEESRQAIRRVREGGVDRYEDAKSSTGEWDIVWVHENFVRLEGKDWHFWSVGRHGFLSKVRETHEAYPAHGGERPYVMGVTQIDTHRTFPMSPAESWQPLQLEINDLTNLRLDTLKRHTAPLAKVKSGKGVDLTQLQRRGRPDSFLLLDSMDDVEFEQPQSPPAQSYQETSITANLFDDLTGSFSGSSVQNTRSMNETVGGMKLLSGSAGSMTEFDLRVWGTTWVERALRQVAHLIRYYENDEKMISIAGGKARVMEEFGVLPGVDDFERLELILDVNIGIGSPDPMQRLEKLGIALKMLEPYLDYFMQQGVKLKPETLIEETFGTIGYKDGRRFFEFGDPPQQQPDPRIEQEKMKSQTTLEKTDQDNETKIELQRMKAGADMAGRMVDVQERQRSQETQIGADDRRTRMQQIFDSEQGGPGGKPNGGGQGQPRGQPLQSPAEGQQVVIGAILDRLEGVSQQVMGLGEAVSIIAEQMDAPVELQRDPETGRAIGVVKNNRMHRLVRDERGRAAGTVPIEGGA